jgi:hypothetical protein
MESLLYPYNRLFEVGDANRQYTLKPFSSGSTEEALVLPAELAGIVPGTTIR